MAPAGIQARCSKKGKTHIMVWERSFEMIADGNLMRNTKQMNSTYDGHRRRAHQGFRESNWIGRDFYSWEEVVAAATAVWHDGLQQVERMQEQIARQMPVPKTRKRKGRWSESNGEIDIDRTMRGEFEYMRDHRRETNQGPATISLICNVGGTYDVSATAMLWRSAAAVAVIDVLEQAGYAVELWMYNQADHAYQNRENVFMACKVKECSDVLDKGQIINVLAPWFFRTLNFACRHIAPIQPYDSYGSSIHSRAGFEDVFDTAPNCPAYEMRCVTTQRDAIAEAQRLLSEVIGELQN